jgi:signal transduction histidine kinase
MAVALNSTSVRERIRDADHVEAVDARMLVVVRCVLAFAALAIIFIDPLEPSRWVVLTYSSLVLYCLYSAAAVWMSFRAGWPTPGRATYWSDVGFYVYLVALTQGTSSIFFFFFFFSIIAASFSRGHREGVLVTGASVVLFLVVGLLTAPSGAAFELDRTLIRPIYLFGLGYMIAYWGGYEIQLRRRLRLLQEMSSVWNPRFGVEHTIGSNLDRLLDYFDADACILVLRRHASPPSYQMCSATRQKTGRSTVCKDITESTANELMQLPGTVGAIHRDTLNWRLPGFYAHFVYNLEAKIRTPGFFDVCRALANLLDARAFVTVPYDQRDGTSGRLYVTSQRPRFGRQDIDFLAQFASTLSIVIENMSLLEELVFKAAENERLKVSRDLHDTTLQPYIGIKLAIDALNREAGTDNPLSTRIAKLGEMVGETIRDLRNLASTLREKERLPGEFLSSALANLVDRYRRFYGIEVEMKSDISPALDGRLAEEAYQIVAEGLSNVLRHTNSKKASVSVRCEDARLRVDIANPTGDEPNSDSSFTPRSISERADALGGTATVDRSPDSYTVVRVEIPFGSATSHA